MNKLKVCFFSPVHDKTLFNKVGFYRDDIKALSVDLCEVIPTNNLAHVFRQKPNLLVAYFYGKSLFAAILGKANGAKVIFTGGADQIAPEVVTTPRLYLNRLFAFLCLIFANEILVSCLSDRSRFLDLALGVNKLKKKVIYKPHVVVPSMFPPIVREPLPGKFQAFTICWMGSIGNVQRKGVDRSIKLIAELRKLGVDATLDIVGTHGVGSDYLKSICLDLGVDKFVTFRGQISDAEKNVMLNEYIIYLQLSSYEGFGVAAAEAFFSGVIVIHTNTGGLSDVINEDGVIVDLDRVTNISSTYASVVYDKYLNFTPRYHSICEKYPLYKIENRSRALLG